MSIPCQGYVEHVITMLQLTLSFAVARGGLQNEAMGI